MGNVEREFAFHIALAAAILRLFRKHHAVTLHKQGGSIRPMP